MKKNNSIFGNNIVSKILLIFLFLLGINVQAQFSANWPFTSDLGATVTGASSSNVTASAATYTSGATGLFTGAVTSSTGSLVGTGINGKTSSTCGSLYNTVSTITPYMEYKITPNSGYSMTTDSFTFTVTYAKAASGSSISAGYSSDGGTTFTGLLAPTADANAAANSATVNNSPTGSTWTAVSITTSTPTALTFTVPAATIAATKSFILRIVIWRNSGSAHSTANISISSPTITGTTAASISPVIATPSPASLSGFTYIAWSGPSASQSFTVSGNNLSADITATASTNYEVSSDNTTFSSTATVAQTSGSASGTLYTRLKSGLAAGTYNSENIVLSSTGATSQNVTCSGGVTGVYYYAGTVALENVTSWGLNTNGSGANPTNFTTAYQTFIIKNTTAVATTAPWNVSGTASKIILGDSSSPAVTLTIAAGNGISGTLDIAAASSGSNELVLQDTSVPTFGSLDPNSMIDIQAAITFAGTSTYPNNISVSNEGVLTLGNNVNGYIYTIGGNLMVTGTGGITNTGGSSANTLVLSGIGKTYINTAAANNFAKTNIIIDGTYALAGDATLAGAISSRSIIINSGKSLDLAGYTLDLSLGSLGGSGGITSSTANSKVVTSNTSLTPLPSGRTWGGTVEYASLTGSQTIVSATSYTNLKLDNTSGTNTVNSGNLTISAAGSLTVNSGTTLSLPGALVNNAAASAVVIENNANLIQTSAAANTGIITVNRNSNDLSRYDYTLWSSPVTNASQFLTSFSPVTDAGRFYNYTVSSNSYSYIASPSTTPFVNGVGYLIRMPNTAVTAPATEMFNGQFSGVLNNGNVATPLTYIDATHPYNLVGNPYPSTINADLLFSSNTANIETTLYFWRRTNGQTSSAYATYTPMGGTGTAASGSSAVVPSGIIQVGQGFIVAAKSGATTLSFTNSMRLANNANQFFKTKQLAEKDRVWLNLTNSEGAFSQMLLGYTTDSSIGIDANDGKYINDSATALTSNINGDDYVIQGRPAFDASDVVALNFKAEKAGTFTIAKDHADGLFAAGQDVYLVDATTGTETNLQTDGYTFTATAGISNGRFSLKYQKTLGVNANTFNDNSVKVYRNNGILTVSSGSKAISSIKVFDIQGRVIAEQNNVNANSTTINNLRALHQVILVKVTGADNSVVTKKVVN